MYAVVSGKVIGCTEKQRKGVDRMEPVGFTRKQTAARLNCSTFLVDKLIRRDVDPLPAVMIGGKVIVPAADFESWMKRQPKPNDKKEG